MRFGRNALRRTDMHETDQALICGSTERRLDAVAVGQAVGGSLPAATHCRGDVEQVEADVAARQELLRRWNAVLFRDGAAADDHQNRKTLLPSALELRVLPPGAGQPLSCLRRSYRPLRTRVRYRIREDVRDGRAFVQSSWPTSRPNRLRGRAGRAPRMLVPSGGFIGPSCCCAGNNLLDGRPVNPERAPDPVEHVPVAARHVNGCHFKDSVTPVCPVSSLNGIGIVQFGMMRIQKRSIAGLRRFCA